MLKIVKEITEWTGVEYRQPNHVYLVDGDRAYAYSAWGEGKPQYFRTPTRLDRRGRKFVDVTKNIYGFDMKLKIETKKQPMGKTWSVTGSKGTAYTVTQEGSHWTCTCPGASFRGSCRHIDEIKAKNT
jgi:hypothetical protein